MDYEIKEAQRKHGWKMSDEIEEEYDEDEDGNEIYVERCSIIVEVFLTTAAQEVVKGEADKDAIEAKNRVSVPRFKETHGSGRSRDSK